MTPGGGPAGPAGWPGPRGGRADGAGNENGAGRWRGQPLADRTHGRVRTSRPGRLADRDLPGPGACRPQWPDSPGWRGRSADRAEPRSAPGRGDLSDLWRDPDPWGGGAARTGAGAGTRRRNRDDRAGPPGTPRGQGARSRAWPEPMCRPPGVPQRGPARGATPPGAQPAARRPGERPRDRMTSATASQPTYGGGMSTRSSRATASSPVTSAATPSRAGTGPRRTAVPAATGPRTTRTQPHGRPGSRRSCAARPGRADRGPPAAGRVARPGRTAAKGPAKDPAKDPVKGRVSSQPPDGRSARNRPGPARPAPR